MPPSTHRGRLCVCACLCSRWSDIGMEDAGTGPPSECSQISYWMLSVFIVNFFCWAPKYGSHWPYFMKSWYEALVWQMTLLDSGDSGDVEKWPAFFEWEKNRELLSWCWTALRCQYLVLKLGLVSGVLKIFRIFLRTASERILKARIFWTLFEVLLETGDFCLGSDEVWAFQSAMFLKPFQPVRG